MGLYCCQLVLSHAMQVRRRIHCDVLSDISHAVPPAATTCNGHGTCSSVTTRCICDHKHTGDFCASETNCAVNLGPFLSATGGMKPVLGWAVILPRLSIATGRVCFMLWLHWYACIILLYRSLAVFGMSSVTIASTFTTYGTTVATTGQFYVNSKPINIASNLQSPATSLSSVATCFSPRNVLQAGGGVKVNSQQFVMALEEGNMVRL